MLYGSGMEMLPLELRKLGLKEKEVDVYLAALELGYSSVQKIAQQAGISRPTTYEIIKTLEKKGFITESKQKGKRYFSTESPDRLLGILRMQKREIEEKEREFIRIIAALRAKYYLAEQGEIKIYQGKDGLGVLDDDFLCTQAKEIYVLSSQGNSRLMQKREKSYQKIKKRLGQIQIKELYSVKIKKGSKIPYLERKYFRGTPSNFQGTLIIYDKVIFLPSKKPTGFLIENETIVNLIKSLFLAIWNLI